MLAGPEKINSGRRSSQSGWAGAPNPGWAGLPRLAGPPLIPPARPASTAPAWAIRLSPGWAGTSFPSWAGASVPRPGRHIRPAWAFLPGRPGVPWASAPPPHPSRLGRQSAPGWAGTSPPGWTASARPRLGCQLLCPGWTESGGSGLAGISLQDRFSSYPG
jgi:hypothetical protein